MKKIILIALPAFAAGIIVQRFVMPYFATKDIKINSDTLISNKTPDVKSIIRDKFFYDTLFDGEKFNVDHIDVPYGDYFTLTNKSSEATMETVSDYAPLSSPRPYGEGEQIKARMDMKGNFYIEEKGTHQRMTISVK